VSEPRDQWQRALRPSGDCVAVERFGAPLTPAEREHIAACPRCRAETALWQAFDAQSTMPEEVEDVRWIVDEIARRRTSAPSEAPMSSRRYAVRSRALAAAAMIFVALGIGYVLNNRSPSIDVPGGRDMLYRSAGIRVVAPTGDVAAAPARLEWVAVPDATGYDVQILEVDRAVLWRGSTRAPQIDVPAAVKARFVPGKTIVWEVTAHRDATVLAESGTQKFRVAVR
jgi:hypothetical protein